MPTFFQLQKHPIINQIANQDKLQVPFLHLGIPIPLNVNFLAQNDCRGKIINLNHNLLGSTPETCENN